MKTYDVIVIGAGNGSLVAAATMEKHGCKTLLLEQYNIPGGCATSNIYTHTTETAIKDATKKIKNITTGKITGKSA